MALVATTQAFSSLSIHADISKKRRQLAREREDNTNTLAGSYKRTVSHISVETEAEIPDGRALEVV